MKYYWIKSESAYNNQNRRLKTLKVLFSFLFITLMSLNANTFSQKTISLNFENAAIKDVFAEIETKSDYIFLYSGNIDREMDAKVNITALSETIEKVLDSLTKDSGLKYSVLEKQIIVYKEGAEANANVVSTTLATQQEEKKITVSGTVEDSTGEPIAGVTIRVKGTMRGTTTKPDGSFFITLNPETEKTLQISCISFKSKEIDVTKSEHLHLVLEDDVSVMEALVVTGIFTRKADSYTGAVKTINKEEIQRTGNLNLLQALGNISPAFQIISNNEMGSDPNAVLDIQMRGSTSFTDMKDKYSTNPNQPLFIVDGFETSITKVMDMDMNRVESITLLKDATAKAIYGSKGANGVVVVETIRPAKGTLRTSYIGNLNIQAPDLTSYNMANAMEKLEIEERAGLYGLPFLSNPQNAQKREEYNRLYKEILGGADINWMKIPLRVGIGQKHTINVEGGDESMIYNASLGYNDIKGTMRGSDRKTIDGVLSLSYRYKNLLFREQLNVTFTDSENSPYGSFNDYVKMNPYWRAYEEDGSVRRVLGSYAIANSQGYHNIYNPLLNADSNYKNTSSYMNVTNNFYIEWQAFQDLKFTARLGISKEKGDGHIFYPSNYAPLNPNQTFAGTNINFINVTPDSGEAYFKRGIYQISNDEKSSVTAEASANYSKLINKHLFFANLVYTVSESKLNSVSSRAVGFADRATSISQALSYQENSKHSGFENTQRDLGVIAAVNYSYDSRYLADFSYRANASSLFGVDNRWGNFGALGFGWNVHNESFFKDSSWLDQMRIRLSTGYTGSQNFAAYQAISMYRYFLDDVYDNNIGGTLIGLPNPSLGWQRTKDSNIGLDFSFLKKFDIKFDYYEKNTNNMLTPIAVVTSTGFNVYQENLGKTKNSGFEAEVRYRVIADSKGDKFFSVNAAIASNRNKVVEINEALSSLNSSKDDSTIGAGGSIIPDHEKNKDNLTRPKVRYAEGQSLSAIWAVRSLGINPADGREIFLDKDGNRVSKWNPEDQVVVGDALEKFRGNFGFNLDYKGFIVNSIFSFRFGGQQYNTTLVDKVENLDIQYNVDKRAYTDSWTTIGQQAKYKQITSPNYFTNPSSRFVFDLNELRMTNLSVGYDFRNCNFIKNQKPLSALKITLNMNDVFTVSTIKQERGTSYPFARAFVCTLQASF